MDRKTREALLVAKNVTGRARGGRAPFALKSKAAEVARSLPQEKGSVDQMMAMLRKAGVKPAEIEHAGVPEGKTITREELARHFEMNVPKIKVSQYGEQPSNPENRGIVKRLNEIGLNYQNATPEEKQEYEVLQRRMHSPNVFETDDDEPEIEPTKYWDYILPGGRDYRERLIHLPANKSEKAYRVQAFNGSDRREFSSEEEARAYAAELERRDGGERAYIREFSAPNRADFVSNHWDTPNVLAHIRMTDRTTGWNPAMTSAALQRIADHMGAKPHELGSASAKYGVENGLISPEEAATLSRRLGWRNEFADKKGVEKRILHVEEIQSDWAQGGRESGFHDPKNPYEIFRTDTGQTISKHPTYEEMWDAFRAMPEEEALGVDYGHAGEEKPPAAPYVQNTQHWTDLALKNVLFEAANGGYDHVVFSPGQANADRYSLEQFVDGVHYEPETKFLYADRNGRRVYQKSDVEPKDVVSHIGKDAAERLLHPDNSYNVGNTLKYSITGDDLRVGGQGMKGYYDNILPKSVMRLAQQHDPEITPGTMELPGTEEGQTYQGFTIPVTDKLKQGILRDGQNYFKRGGRVGYNNGGYVPAATLPVGRLRTAIPHRPLEMPVVAAPLSQLASLGKSAAGIAEAAAGKQPDQPQQPTEAGPPAPVAKVLDLAAKQMGMNEKDQNAALREYLTNGGVNLDPATTAWCAAYMNATLNQSGYEGTGSNLARSFLDWGEAAEQPQIGDIAVFSRGDPNGPYGHVGFFQGYGDDGSIKVLGGNQSNSVSIANYPAERLLGFRRPAEGWSPDPRSRIQRSMGGYVPAANLPVARLRTPIPHRSTPAPALGGALDSLAGIGKSAIGIAEALTGKSDQLQQAEAAGRPQQQPDDAYPSGRQPSDAVSNFLGLIDRTEGGGNYSTLFGHSQAEGKPFAGTDVSKMTLGQLYDFSDPGGEYGQWVKGNVGRVSTPMGRYQIVGTTLRHVADQMGLSPDTMFTPQLQDAIADHLARQRLARARTPEEKRRQLRLEWEGFRKVEDEELDRAIAEFEAAGGMFGARQPGQAYATGGSVGGDLEKARAREAVERAGGQIAPSKYLPDVPRAVHADGGKVEFLKGNHPDVPDTLYHGTTSDFTQFFPLAHFGTMKAAHQRLDESDAWNPHWAFVKNKANVMPVHVSMKNPLDLGPEGYEGVPYWKTNSHMLTQVAQALYDKGHRYHADEMDRIIDGLKQAERRDTVGPHLIPHLKRAANVIEDAGYDGLSYENAIEDKGSQSFVALHPHQVKSAISATQFDPNNPDMRFADGGEVADLGVAREQKQMRDFHKGMMGDIRSGVSNLMEAHQKAVDAGAFEGYSVGDMLKGSAGPMRIENMFVRKWKPNSLMSRHFDRMNVAPTIIEHEGEAYVPMVRYSTGREDDPDWQQGDAYMDMIRAAGYPKMGGLRAVKAAGGAVDGMEAFYRDMHPELMDEQGKPLDLYHGTPGEPFEAFDDKKIGQRYAGFYGRGHYLTPERDNAEEYGNVMGPLHAALKNPFVWDLSDEAKADRTKRKLTEFGVMKGHKGELRSWDNLQRWEVDKFTNAALNAGHDGVIMKTHSGPKEIVVFDPRKIKHATKNSGAFDTTNPNIYKASGGPVDGDPQAIPGASPARPQAGELPVAGGLGGGRGVLPAQDEAPLEGLPQRVKVPLTGEVIQAGPDPRIRQVARQYMAMAGLPYNPPTKYAKVDPARAKRIAAAYEAMPDEPDHPLVRASYAQMIKETMDQYRAAKAAGFKAEFWNPATDKDPYEASPRLAVEDVRKNHHMYVYPTSAGYGTGQEITEEDVRKNPMLADSGERWNGIPVTVNDIFRAVHDYYGHAKEGVGFRADGEENAWRAHASMFSPLARMAMTAETRGQNSWLNYGPHGESNRTARTEDTVFAPQKIGVLPHWAHHEGAEDFITPESRQQMADIMRKHGKLENDVVGDALRLTRGAFKDGGAPGFFSKEAGQARRQALNEAISSFIPPGLRPAAEAIGSMTPIAGLERSGQAAQQAFDPSLSAGQRAASGATAVAEALGVAAPLALAGRAAVPATQIAREVLTGGYNPDFGKGWEDAYHYTQANEMFDRFDPNLSREAFSRIGPHVGTMKAAEDRAASFNQPSGVGIIPLKANTSRPFVNPSTGEPFREVEIQDLIRAVADDHGVDLRGAAHIMRDRLAREGYTNIPYFNNAEDPGSISNVMLTLRPQGDDAVLRHRDAAFSPHRATSPNLMASAVPAAVGATGYAAYSDDDYSGGPR